MKVRRNSDKKLRELEREVKESGDLDAAIKLYWEQRRRFGPRKHQSLPSYDVEIPKHGWVEFTPRGDTVGVGSPGPGHDPDPVIVNRVPYAVHGVYFDYPKLGWTPVRPESLDHVLRQKDYDPTQRYMTSFSLDRIDRMPREKASHAAYAKFMKALNPIFQKWVKSKDGKDALRRGRETSANNRIWNAQGAFEKLSAEIAEVQRVIAESIVYSLQP